MTSLGDLRVPPLAVKAIRALACVIGLLLPGMLWAQTSLVNTPVLALNGPAAPEKLDAYLEFFIDTTGALKVGDIEQAPLARFSPIQRGTRYWLGDGTLWLRFNAIATNSQTPWHLMVPQATVDDVTLYFANSTGERVMQRAGDTVAMSSWAQSGRYPVFSLSPETGRPVTYLLKVRHSRVPYSVLPQIVSESSLIKIRQDENMLLGIYFGLAALLIIVASVNSLIYRDSGFASYLVYITFFAASQAATAGVAGLYLWPQWPVINNGATIILLACAAAAACWFVRVIAVPRRYSRVLDWVLLTVICALPPVGVLNAWLPLAVSTFAAYNILVAAGMVALVGSVLFAAFEDECNGRWIALGAIPVLAGAVFALLRNLGLLPSGLLTEYGLMMGSVLQAPILLWGLHRRVAQRRNVSARISRIKNIDPLTGLHSSDVVTQKLRQSLLTFERYKLPFALLVVDLTNVVKLQKLHGRETADRAMVLAAACLRGVADSTTILARVGEAQFALLLEGPISADTANAVATKILAGGLRPTAQLPDFEPLQFHIAVGHFSPGANSTPTEACAFLARMLKTLQDMNDGSRKAIRLVNP